MTPFYLDLRRNLNKDLHPQNSNIPSANELAECLQQLTKLATECLQQAQQNQKKYADQKCNDIEFNINDEVLINTGLLNPNVYRNLPSKKLLPRFTGPYRIINKISNITYKL